MTPDQKDPRTQKIHAIVSRWADSTRIPLSFDDWEPQVVEDGDLEGWVEFNINEYLDYILSYQRGEAEDQGAHGEPWLSADEQKIINDILDEVAEVMA